MSRNMIRRNAFVMGALLGLSSTPSYAQSDASATAGAQAQKGIPEAPTTQAVAPLGESLHGEAKAEYAAARVLYDDGDFAGALTKLQTAYRVSKDPRLLWNMAAAEKNLRHYGKTIALVESYLAAGEPWVTLEDREQANALLTTMRDFVSPVKFEVSPAGTRIEIDGTSIGASPLEAPVPLDFGKREIKFSKPGYLPETRAVELEGGKPLTMSVELKAEQHQGTLRIVTEPNTSIRLDGKVVGLGMWQGVVPSGAHALQFEASKKVPQTMEVLLSDGETRAVNIQLKDEAAADKGGIPTWIWITGGVAAAALGTGAYFALRHESSRPPIQEGTWGTLEF